MVRYPSYLGFGACVASADARKSCAHTEASWRGSRKLTTTQPNPWHEIALFFALEFGQSCCVNPPSHSTSNSGSRMAWISKCGYSAERRVLRNPNQDKFQCDVYTSLSFVMLVAHRVRRPGAGKAEWGGVGGTLSETCLLSSRMLAMRSSRRGDCHRGCYSAILLGLWTAQPTGPWHRRLLSY